MTQNTQTVVPGSILDAATTAGVDPARQALSAGAVIGIDVSGSMTTHDAGERGSETRLVVARREAVKVQATYPGRVVLAAWSDIARFCWDGVLPNSLPMGGTTAMSILNKMSVFEENIPLVFISDGHASDQDDALDHAKAHRRIIHTIFTGDPESSEGAMGIAFLQKLAAAGKGEYDVTAKPGLLLKSVMLLLGTSFA